MIFRFTLALILFLNSLLLPADCSFVLASDGVPTFSSVFSGTYDERYWLDGAGNWENRFERSFAPGGYTEFRRNFQINDMNEYTNENEQNYNTQGQLIDDVNISLKSDPNGNQWEWNQNREYRFDYLNRLVRVLSRLDETQKAQYFYDSQNRRVRGEQYNGATFVSAQEYVYSGSNCIVEYEDSNATPGGASLAREYVFGASPDEVLQIVENAGFTGVYAFNGRHNISELVDEGQSAAQGVVQTSKYDPYGVPTTYLVQGQNQPGFQPYKYGGKRYDEESKLYYFNARYHDPYYGRFVSRDPHGIWGDPVNIGNPYTYCGNNPVNMSDPKGMLTMKEFYSHPWENFKALFGQSDEYGYKSFGKMGKDIKSFGTDMGYIAKEQPLMFIDPISYMDAFEYETGAPLPDSFGLEGNIEFGLGPIAFEYGFNYQFFGAYDDRNGLYQFASNPFKYFHPSQMQQGRGKSSTLNWVFGGSMGIGPNIAWETEEGTSWEGAFQDIDVSGPIPKPFPSGYGVFWSPEKDPNSGGKWFGASTSWGFGKGIFINEKVYRKVQ